jgi:hypothetical protein
MRVQLEKLRVDAVECALIRDLATDAKKRELFGRRADRLSALALDVEEVVAGLGTPVQKGHVSATPLPPGQAG